MAQITGYKAKSLVATAASTIPTIGEWGLIILTVGLLIFGLVTIRQRVLHFN